MYSTVIALPPRDRVRFVSTGATISPTNSLFYCDKSNFTAKRFIYFRFLGQSIMIYCQEMISQCPPPANGSRVFENEHRTNIVNSDFVLMEPRLHEFTNTSPRVPVSLENSLIHRVNGTLKQSSQLRSTVMCHLSKSNKLPTCARIYAVAHFELYKQRKKHPEHKNPRNNPTFFRRFRSRFSLKNVGTKNFPKFQGHIFMKHFQLRFKVATQYMEIKDSVPIEKPTLRRVFLHKQVHGT